MQQDLKTRLLRKFFYHLPKKYFFSASSWRKLRFYPPIEPDQGLLQRFASSQEDSYQQWLHKNTLVRRQDWLCLRKEALNFPSPPRISIVTPVHNTPPHILTECVLSVRTQAYPFWQWVLFDDSSRSQATHKILESSLCQDPRIQIHYGQSPQGISAATNQAIAHTQGDYILFLDHDDCLSPDALFYLAEQIIKYPDTDIVYADRDMIMTDGRCFMHLFKPGWSPETLLSGNYIFHPMCYRRRLLLQLGGLRSEFDGSQDYDLILRASETEPEVRHIAKILYHWRQHEQSVALDAGAKDYAFAAGIRALNAALKRRGIAASANEIKDLWRGNYQLQLNAANRQDIAIIQLDTSLPIQNYSQFVSRAIAERVDQQQYIAILSTALYPDSRETLTRLAAWLNISPVGLVSGRIDSEDDRIHYAGMAFKKNADLIISYQGFTKSEPGYMAVTRICRNISAPHPYCVVLRTDLWRQLKGFDKQFQGPYALLDFALRALSENWRSVFVAQAQFTSQKADLLAGIAITDDRCLLQKKWRAWLAKGDPYYNPNLDENSTNMRLQTDIPE